MTRLAAVLALLSLPCHGLAQETGEPQSDPAPNAEIEQLCGPRLGIPCPEQTEPGVQQLPPGLGARVGPRTSRRELLEALENQQSDDESELKLTPDEAFSIIGDPESLERLEREIGR